MFFLDTCENISGVINYIKKLVKIMQLFVPILLIIWGSVDMFKGIVSGDEKKIAAGRTALIKRFGVAIAVFLVPAILEFVIKYVGGSSDWIECWNSTGDKVNIIEYNN